MERIQHPFKNDYTCIIVKVKCNCSCHTAKGIMHFVPCCDNGYVNFYKDEKLKK